MSLPCSDIFVVGFRVIARVAELADALDLGSSGLTVGVRVPPLAPLFFETGGGLCPAAAQAEDLVS